MASAIDLQTHVDAPQCEAAARPLPGPDAVPVSLCRSSVQAGSCVGVPAGVMGPCIEGDPLPRGLQRDRGRRGRGRVRRV
ncbi:MAG: hypothetical protein U0168_29395 [Nannocystaceae bacterium]